MPATANANMMSLVHAGSSGISMIFPDVCKTPTPGGPIPIPYPNIAQSSDTADGSSTVKVDGNPIMLKGSSYRMSTGDEAGSAMGVVSNKIKGKAEPAAYSFDVKADGANVFRLTDMMLQNVGQPNPPPGTNLQPPLVGKTLKIEECKKTQAKREDEKEGAAPAWQASGIVPNHRGPILEAAKQFHCVLYFRQTKPESGPWINRGHLPKPHACTEGTTIASTEVIAARLAKAVTAEQKNKFAEKLAKATKNASKVQNFLDDHFRKNPDAKVVNPQDNNDGYSRDAADYVGLVGVQINDDMIEPRKGGGSQTVSYKKRWTVADYDLFEVLKLGRRCRQIKGDEWGRLRKYINTKCGWDAIQHRPQTRWCVGKKDIAKGSAPIRMPAEVRRVLKGKAPLTHAVQTLPPPRDLMKVLDTPLTVVSGNGVATLDDEQAVRDALVCQECDK